MKSVRSSSAVLRLGATPSRSVPVFEALGKVNGQWVRLGMDTLAGVSCVGRADLSKEEQALDVPTSERLHHAGGESLRTNMEVTLEVDIMGASFDVTFNVIESGRFPLGFLLGMDVLEKHDFVLNAATRQVEFRRVPLPQSELEENRAFREKELTSVGATVAACLPLNDDFDDVSPRVGQGVSVRVVRPVVLDTLVEVPAFTKQMVKAVFPRLEQENELDLATENWVFLPLESDDEALRSCTV